MPFQPQIPEMISSAESEALARFVGDLEIRMKHVSDLLKERGTPNAAVLAGSIARDLGLLERELMSTDREHSVAAAPAFASSTQ